MTLHSFVVWTLDYVIPSFSCSYILTSSGRTRTLNFAEGNFINYDIVARQSWRSLRTHDVITGCFRQTKEWTGLGNELLENMRCRMGGLLLHSEKGVAT